MHAQLRTRHSVDLRSIVCDDHVIDPDTCRQHQLQQLQPTPLRAHDQKATAPCRAARARRRDLFEDGVNFNATRAQPQCLHVDLTMVRGKAHLAKTEYEPLLTLATRWWTELFFSLLVSDNIILYRTLCGPGRAIAMLCVTVCLSVCLSSP